MDFNVNIHFFVLISFRMYLWALPGAIKVIQTIENFIRCFWSFSCTKNMLKCLKEAIFQLSKTQTIYIRDYYYDLSNQNELEG